MDAFGMLNALIGLALVYFVLSLIVSAAMEWLSQVMSYRGHTLELATARLMGLDAVPKAPSDSGSRNDATAALRPATPAGTQQTGGAQARREDDKAAMITAYRAFFVHPRIQSLQQDTDRKPSYIPNDTYAAVFIESLIGLEPREWRNAPALLRRRIEALPAPVKASLLALLDEASGDPVKFAAGVEAWVNRRGIGQRDGYGAGSIGRCSLSDWQWPWQPMRIRFACSRF